MPQNCWEKKMCARGPGGSKVNELGVCPAATKTEFDTINHGKNGGRFCWQVMGTLCGGRVQRTQADKDQFCKNCPFPKQVEKEEGKNFKPRA